MAISHGLETEVLLWEGDTCPEVGRERTAGFTDTRLSMSLPSAGLIDQAAH